MAGSNPNNTSGPFGCIYRDEDVMEEMTGREKLNEQKRAHMSRVVAGLVTHGWTVAQLAAYMGCDATTVRAWKSGKSMGNNHQRGQLVELLAHGPARVLVAERVAALDATVAHESKLARDAGIHESMQRYSSERMVRAQNWRETLAERLK